MLEEVFSMAMDPVCKMSVGETEAKYTSMHQGRVFYFCSAACKQQFDKEPQKYAR